MDFFFGIIVGVIIHATVVKFREDRKMARETDDKVKSFLDEDDVKSNVVR